MLETSLLTLVQYDLASWQSLFPSVTIVALYNLKRKLRWRRQTQLGTVQILFEHTKKGEIKVIGN